MTLRNKKGEKLWFHSFWIGRQLKIQVSLFILGYLFVLPKCPVVEESCFCSLSVWLGKKNLSFWKGFIHYSIIEKQMPGYMWRNPCTFELPCPAFNMVSIFSQRLIKWDWRECCSSLSRVWLFATPWIAAHQAPLSVGFPRQEYSSGLPFSSAGVLPDPGIKPVSSVLVGRFSTTEPPGKTLRECYLKNKKGQW